MSLAARTKQWTARNLQKLCAQRDPVPIFVPEFYRGYLKKGCVHVSAQRVPYLGRPCLGTKCSESCKMDRSSDLLRNTWPAYTFNDRSILWPVLTVYNLFKRGKKQC
ncbi:unnamed protein product [Porites evermanni]|uniref:Uncharacterized protein n=1 Tax=Porites evermanni TaxID=104178 RepID=A0ABN8SN10_9CNID|nr:unnamed protein product [Porites evermanni]